MWRSLWDRCHLTLCAACHAVVPEGRGSIRKVAVSASVILGFQKQHLLRLQTPTRRDFRNFVAQNRVLQILENTEEPPLCSKYSSALHQLFLNVEMNLLLPLYLTTEISLCLIALGHEGEILFRSFTFFKSQQCFSLKPCSDCHLSINTLPWFPS